jgi:hypothetical protein
MSKEDLKASIIFILVYLGIYLTVMYFWTRPWKLQAAQRMVQGQLDRARGMGPLLTGAQEILVREFRDQVTRWDHDQMGTRDKPKGRNQP